MDTTHKSTQVQPLEIDADGNTNYRWDVQQTALRPFSLVEWSYQFALADGTTFQSGTYSIRYNDNRFPWQTLSSDMVQVNWYNGDANFGRPR